MCGCRDDVQGACACDGCVDTDSASSQSIHHPNGCVMSVMWMLFSVCTYCTSVRPGTGKRCGVHLPTN